MTEIRTASAIVIATVFLALVAAPDALASKEKFVRDKPHVNIDAAAATETEAVDQAAAGHDHGEAKSGGCKMHDMKADGGGCKMHDMQADGGGCKMHDMKADGGGCKMHDMKAKGGECKMHDMKAKKEGKEQGCKMMQMKQERMQMNKQSGAEHKHGDEEAT